MITFFRRMFDSRIGTYLTLAFVALIAFAFATSDISNSITGGGSGVGDGLVAEVGNASVTMAEVRNAATNKLEEMKQQDPGMTMKRFVDEGYLTRTVDAQIDRVAMEQFGRSYGMIAGDRLIDSEIAQIGAFKGADGKFSDDLFRQALTQSGINETTLRQDFARGLVAQQIMQPVSEGSIMPVSMASRYVNQLKETRSGQIAFLPSLALAPKDKPTPQLLQAFYTQNRENYVKPEQRMLRYATFTEAAVRQPPAPTEAEVAALYQKRSAEFAASESRRLTQVILPTQPAAQALAAEVAGGKSLDAAAREKGLAAAALDPISKEALRGQASSAVADAVFAASRGAIATPARSGLGWHVIRVDAIEGKAARSLEAVRPMLTAELAALKKREALNSMAERIESQFDEGGALGDVAQELGINVVASPLLIASGQSASQPSYRPDAIAQALLGTAFAMEKEGEPQLAELQKGQQFAIFDVAEIVPATPAPLAEIGDRVGIDYATAQGSDLAKKAAQTIVAAIAKGTAMNAAITAASPALPQAQPVNLSREQLMSQQRVPPPLALLFSMAKNSVKQLEAPGKQGWFVVWLKDILLPPTNDNDPMVAQMRDQLGPVLGQEYEWQFARAVRAQLAVSQNDAAVKALRDQLVGAGPGGN